MLRGGYAGQGPPAEGQYAQPRAYRGGRGQDDEPAAPSAHLWVGNVTPDITDDVLLTHFGRYGEVQSATAYPQRNYAFVNFTSVAAAQEAKRALSGASIGAGQPIRVEFAKGAASSSGYGHSRASRHLWVGGIGKTVTRQQLELEFTRFGRLEDFTFMRERSCAFVDYAALDDAVAAVEHLNGKFVGDERLRVDFGKGGARAPDERERGGGKGHGESSPRNNRRPPPDGGRGGHFAEQNGRAPPDAAEPSEVLWVGFPLWVHVTDDVLRREFEPFGEIARIKTFPGRTYAFVQFTRAADAARAKTELVGKLFNEPRVHIKFSHSMPAAGGAEAGGAGRDTPPARRAPPASAPRGGQYAEDSYSARPAPYQPTSPSGRAPAAEYNPKRRDAEDASEYYRPASTRSQQPTAPAPAQGRYNDWGDEEPREPKRLRYEADTRNGAGYDAQLPPVGLEKGYEVDRNGLPQRNQAAQPRPAQAAPVAPPVAAPWAGTLAKGGALICGALGHPVGKGISAGLPDMINCSARTDLDTLAKHIYAAKGFGTIAIIPAEAADIPPYEEFVQYLAEKRRAAVARLPDGGSLFLVPPSDFSEQVLRIPHKDSLFGVVLETGAAAGGGAQQAAAPVQPVSLPAPPQQQQPTLLPPPQVQLQAQPATATSAVQQYLPQQQQMAPPTYQAPPPSTPPDRTLQAQQGPPSSAGADGLSGLPQGLTPEVLASLKALIPPAMAQPQQPAQAVAPPPQRPFSWPQDAPQGAPAQGTPPQARAPPPQSYRPAQNPQYGGPPPPGPYGVPPAPAEVAAGQLQQQQAPPLQARPPPQGQAPTSYQPNHQYQPQLQLQPQPQPQPGSYQPQGAPAAAGTGYGRAQAPPPYQQQGPPPAAQGPPPPLQGDQLAQLASVLAQQRQQAAAGPPPQQMQGGAPSPPAAPPFQRQPAPYRAPMQPQQYQQAPQQGPPQHPQAMQYQPQLRPPQQQQAPPPQHLQQQQAPPQQWPPQQPPPGQAPQLYASQQQPTPQGVPVQGQLPAVQRGEASAQQAYQPYMSAPPGPLAQAPQLLSMGGQPAPQALTAIANAAAQSKPPQTEEDAKRFQQTLQLAAALLQQMQNQQQQPQKPPEQQ